MMKQPESVADFKARIARMIRGRESDYRDSPNRAPEWALRKKGDALTPSEVMAFGEEKKACRH